MANFPPLDKLAVAANTKGLFDGMLVYCDRENAKDLEFANGLHNVWTELKPSGCQSPAVGCSRSENQTVGIKRLLDDLRVTDAQLMLLVYKLLLLVFRVNAAGTKLQLLKDYNC
ncbi:hypothetical protein Tco_1399496 [Tanacetum coccineum]